jgi:hypothetical protein
MLSYLPYSNGVDTGSTAGRSGHSVNESMKSERF